MMSSSKITLQRHLIYFLASPDGDVIFRKGESRHITVKNDVINTLTPLRKHRFIPMMSSPGMGNDVIS